MDTINALRTTQEALDKAREALKPAIGDLAHSHDDWNLEVIMRTYLSLRATQTRIQKQLSSALDFRERG